MTLILALSCNDGVVVASDGQMTSGLIRETVQKIKQIEDTTVLWGASGTVGYIQKIERIISRLPVEARSEGLEAIGPLLRNQILGIRSRSVE